MRCHRSVSVLTLVTFLPIAVGCSTQATRQIHSAPDDPDPSADESWLGEEPVKIAGYTDRNDQFHEWEGRVRAVLPDSLEFTREVPDGYWPYPDTSLRPKQAECLRLHREEVVSLRVVEIDGERTGSLLLAIGLVVGLWVFLAVYDPDIGLEPMED